MRLPFDALAFRRLQNVNEARSHFRGNINAFGILFHTDDETDVLSYRVSVMSKPGENRRCSASLFSCKSNQKMHCANMGVAHGARLFLRIVEHARCTRGQSFEQERGSSER